jgi:hypothetical protein
MPRSPTVYASWSTLLRSTRCCSTTLRAARVSPAGRLTRSITVGAIEMTEEFRDSAKDDSDLDPIRDEPACKQLIN